MPNSITSSNSAKLRRLEPLSPCALFLAVALALAPVKAQAADSVLAAGPVPQGMMRAFLTEKDNQAERLTEQTPTPLGKKTGASSATVFIDPSKRFQTILGFGGAFTEAAAVTWKKLGPANQKAVIDAYFDFNSGHGYTLCRTHINSCDFSVSNYAYDETPGDVELKNFSVARDEQALLPMIEAALASSKEPFKLFATPWSPPAWMKTNNDMNHGGKLKPEDRQAWADYFARYIREYRKQGVSIWGLTMQNEPEADTNWDTCLYSPNEERDFIRDYLGPTLSRAGLQNIKILAWDHNRDDMDQYADAIYSDPAASRYVWGTAFHWYSDGAYQNMSTHHDA